MAKFLDKNGNMTEVVLDVAMYREAAEKDQSLETYLNNKFPTCVSAGASTFQQMMASEGLFFSNNPKMGISAPKLRDVLTGKSAQYEAAASNTNVRDGSPQSRILFPAAVLSVIEESLRPKLGESATIFERMVAVTDSINGTRFERPMINFDRPSTARSARISQLAAPQKMLTLTTSDKTLTIPTTSLGIEWSDEFEKSMGIDILALSMSRQAEEEASERAYDYILAALQGDEDVAQSALDQIKASDLDDSITSAGELTQKAWIKWLQKDSKKRRINMIVTDLEGALALEGRTGKPTVQGDNPASTRIDSLPTVANPFWSDSVEIFLIDHPQWPANTIMGLDTSYALHRVRSLTADYKATEEFAMRRGSGMRFDSGEVVYRLFDEAFSVLSLTV